MKIRYIDNKVYFNILDENFEVFEAYDYSYTSEFTGDGKEGVRIHKFKVPNSSVQFHIYGECYLTYPSVSFTHPNIPIASPILYREVTTNSQYTEFTFCECLIPGEIVK